jgi:V8-like Glu-specific endopeptidase
MFDTLTDVVFQVTCGTVNGTCFLINKNTAITVFHVIKEHETSEIIILKNCSKIASAKLHKNIDNDCKTKDFAILTLDQDLTFSKYLEFGLIENIEVGSKWISRGYPLPKSCNGENILPHADNSIGQHFAEITDKKIDVELNHNKKWNSYEGMSGAPLIINNKVVGLINSELTSQETSRELYALSVKSLKDILISNNIAVNEEKFYKEIDVDTSGAEDFQALSSTDIRNLPGKLKDVCATISDRRINLYCRELASGKAELLRYRDQDISATKFRIFEVCQKELLNFVESNLKTELEVSDIDELIELYALKASVIIDERSKDYRYPLKNRDILRKIVLDLINECFLSFDEKGIYIYEE